MRRRPRLSRMPRSTSPERGVFVARVSPSRWFRFVRRVAESEGPANRPSAICHLPSAICHLPSARRLGGSSAWRLGGSSARRLVGSAARRLGGSAAWRLVGLAAWRLGGSAALAGRHDDVARACPHGRRHPRQQRIAASVIPRSSPLACRRRRPRSRAARMAEARLESRQPSCDRRSAPAYRSRD